MQVSALFEFDQAASPLNFAGTPAELKKLWVIPESNHIGGYFDHRQQYGRRVLEFLDEVFERQEGIQQHELESRQ